MTRVEYACMHTATVATRPEGVKATRIIAGCRPCPECQRVSDEWQATHPVKTYRAEESDNRPIGSRSH